MASLDQAAAHCFISSQRFRELLARGAIAKAERGRYDLDKVREQFIRHLSKMAAGRADNGSRLVEERTRLVAAKRRREERQDALEAGRLVPIAPIQRFIENGLRVTRDRLLSMPGELSYLLAGCRQEQVFETLDGAVREALEEIASPEFAARAAAAGLAAANIEPHHGEDVDVETEE
ncbi:hypothetical protein SAMN05443247_00467 [Bradyrhizobium erythrophlei]|jgi:hypothetical protein|nr:hypothetical protein SAMN05443247_00467 [Bradyrhizobium erythrophlei]